MSEGSRSAPRTPLEPVRESEHAPSGRLRAPRTGARPRGVEVHSKEHASSGTGSAICVQNFDDSLNSAIRITYRISLRSSSLREPRYPSAGVVFWLSTRAHTDEARRARARRGSRAPGQSRKKTRSRARFTESVSGGRLPTTASRPAHRGVIRSPHACVAAEPEAPPLNKQLDAGFGKTGNDPSAGSPTETLLRLLLPLNDKVWTASRSIADGEPAASPQSGGLTGSFNR